MDTGENVIVKEETEGCVGIMYGRRQGEGSPVEVSATRARIHLKKSRAIASPFIRFPGLRIES